MPKSEAPWQRKPELITKTEAKTDSKHGCKPEQRPVREYIKHGIINLDKPAGPTSHEVTAWVKRILGVKHAGHGGTLEAYAKWRA
jgi:H/ACA ribonucleoprotein complex subunit 4